MDVYIIIFWVSVSAVLFHLIIFPVIIIAVGLVFNRPMSREKKENDDRPLVSILVTCFNEGEIIRRKAENLLNLNYPQDRLQIIFAADGPKDDPVKWLDPFLKENKVQLIHYYLNRGKIQVINDTLPHCNGEIIVFTDVDAMLHADSLKHLLPIFKNPEIGGCCGRHLIQQHGRHKDSKSIGQLIFWRFDTIVKRAESRLGSISSCYGTIYAIRKCLFTRVPPSVTDDAFQAMAIVRKKKRFVFVPEAVAFIELPSKNYRHELKRRRRIVLRSLRGLWLSRELFNPLRFGFYSFRLFVFKLLRRLTPFFMIGAFFSSGWGCTDNPFWTAAFGSQLIFYGLALVEWTNLRKGRRGSGLMKSIAAVIFYYCVGNLGALMGCVDFARGKKVDRW